MANEQMFFPPASVKSFAHRRFDWAFVVTPQEKALSKATGGFDAVMQFRSDLLNQQLKSSLWYKHTLTSSYLYDDTLLSASAKMAVKKASAKLNAAAPAKTPGEEFQPQWFLLKITDPDVHFSTDPDKEVYVVLDVLVSVQFGRGKDLTKPWESEKAAELIAVGTVAVEPKIKVVKNIATYELLAELDFASCNPTIASVHGTFKELMQGFLPTTSLENAVKMLMAPLLVDQLRLTPKMCFGGQMIPGEKLTGVGAFDVNYALRPYQSWYVLSLCADITPGSTGGLGLVNVFLSNSNFAYYFPEKIAKAVVESRWKRTSTIKQFTTETKAPMKDGDGNLVYGKAKIKWVWTKLVGSYIPPAAGTTGALRVKAWATVTVLKIWNHEGKEASKKDQPDLYKPFKKAYAVDYALFETPSPAPNPKDPVAKQGMQLTQALYRPTASSLQIKNITGMLSGAVKGGVTRGDLGTEAV